ncbi:MAG: hypothetical protein ACRYFE_01915 [Janthinobacterium lividum]
MKRLSVRASMMMVAITALAACNSSEDDGPAQATIVAEAEAKAALETETEVVARPAVFPEAFRGNWDYNENGCRDADAGTRFVITDTQIKGYESTATLRSVETVDELGIRVEMVENSAEGDRVINQTMHLSPVAGISVRIATDDKTIRALRCDPV